MFYRVSTSQLYQNGLDSILRNQSIMNDIAHQISSGKKTNLSPVDLEQSESYNVKISQLAQNIINGERIIPQIQKTELAVEQIKEQMLVLRNLILESQNPATYNPVITSTQFNQIKEQITDLINTKDNYGYFIFSGYAGNNQPFNDITTSTYNGDGGIRKIQIANNVFIDVNTIGNEIISTDFQTSLSQFESFINGIAPFNPTSISQLDSALEKISIVETKIGTSLNLIENYKNYQKEEQNNKIAYVSELTDANIPELISQLQQAKNSVEASMKTYMVIQNLSLFNYM